MAALWAFAFVAVAVRTEILPGSSGHPATAGTPAAEARPVVQGSTSSREPLRTAARAPSVLAAESTSVVAPVERAGVGVWVAARRGLGALGVLKASAEAAPSAIPPSWLVLHRPIAVSVEVQGKDLDELTNAATVGQLLSAMGIEPDGNDRVAPSTRTPLHSSDVVRFDRVDVRTVMLTSNLDDEPTAEPSPW
jgi:G5-linked-Ubiquitin-like domain